MANKTDIKRKKCPPNQGVKSVQYDLFSQFVTNDKSKVSNTVELWEKIPKYFLSAKQVDKLRTAEGYAKPQTFTYFDRGQEFSVDIQPAMLKQPDGTYKAYFPGANEELVEEALKKILSDQNSGLHDPSCWHLPEWPVSV